MTTTAVTDAGAAPAVRHRGPVPRADGARSVRLVAVAFGVTVVVTRLYLALTGYPQIGGGNYHLAHALWGGLLLMVGGIVALLWSKPLGAADDRGVCGRGVGGCSSTRSASSSPPATTTSPRWPLRSSTRSSSPSSGWRSWPGTRGLDRPRSLAYAVAVRLKDLGDGPLRPGTRTALVRDLALLEAESSRPDLAAYAAALRPVVDAAPVEEPSHRFRPLVARLVRAEAILVPRWVARIAIAAGAAVLGLLSLIGLVVLVALGRSDPDVQVILDDQVVPPGTRPPMLVVASAGEAVVGALLLVAAVALLLGRDRTGTRLVRIGLIVALAGVNVALGYLDAELVVVAVVAELALLVLVGRYRARFPRLTPGAPQIRSKLG